MNCSSGCLSDMTPPVKKFQLSAITHTETEVASRPAVKTGALHFFLGGQKGSEMRSTGASGRATSGNLKVSHRTVLCKVGIVWHAASTPSDSEREKSAHNEVC